jgi:hypothetical protein
MKCLRAFCLVACCVVPALGTTVNGVFAPPTNDLGSSYTYMFSGFTVTASGFTDGGSPVDLFGKTAGAGETGVGLVNDPTGAHEITNGSFIQLDVSSLSGFGALTITMNSTTSGETWKVTETNMSGHLGSTIPSCSVFNCIGTSETPFTVSPTMRFLDFTVPSNTQQWNVLLSEIEFQTTPEPMSFVLAGTGLLGLYFIRRRRAG